MLDYSTVISEKESAGDFSGRRYVANKAFGYCGMIHSEAIFTEKSISRISFEPTSSNDHPNMPRFGPKFGCIHHQPL
jgi:hypothetical protein